MPTSPDSQLHSALGLWCPPQEPLLSLRYPPWGGPSLVSFPQSPQPPLSLWLIPQPAPSGQFPPHRWSAKVSAPSRLSVPAVANMMVVSRSAIIPDTALAAVMQAWVPRFPAWSAASTWETCRRSYAAHSEGKVTHACLGRHTEGERHTVPGGH